MNTTGSSFVIKRVYEDPGDDDGWRVLVDRLWPRGISKEQARLDLWLKEIAPSPPLRKDFGHKEEKFDDFRRAYETELRGNPAVDTLRKLGRQHPRVTLLYGAKDPQVNHARVLRDFMHRGGTGEGGD